VDYGYGHVNGYGAIGNRYGHHGIGYGHGIYGYGKRDADAFHYGAVPSLTVGGFTQVASLGHYGYGHGIYGYGKREAEPYTIGQVYGGLPIHNAYATGHPHNVGIQTFTDFGHHGYGYGYGKREAEAEAEPYTIGQVYGGLPVHNAYATGHPHNVGYTRYISHGYGGYPFYG